MRLLFVHGIAQGGRNPAELQKIWTETLQEGFGRAGQPWPHDLKIDFPFYGDLLDEFVKEEDLPPPAELEAKGAGAAPEFETFTRNALDEIQKAKLPEAEVTTELGTAASQEKGPQNWGWVRAIARVIDRRLTPLSDFTIEHFLREVFVYSERAYATKAINALVEEKLTDEPTVVVGHSLGTVVAYNVLRASKGRDLRGLITVGSPLGLRTLAPTLGVLTNPAAKTGWYNAFDPTDVVALRPLAAPYFGVAPVIANHGEVANDTDNHHGIIGYLDDAQVAAHIAKALA